MEVSILEGAYFDGEGNIRASLPVNMWPVLTDNGFSKGYLRTAPGLTQTAALVGVADRGSIVWKGVHYRVLGDALCSVAGNVVTQLGGVGNDGKPVQFDFGFDQLAVCSNDGLFYWDGATFTTVTDPNLGKPIDVCYVDGYYVLTDGTWLYVTELNSPTTILPNASEQPSEDPTPVVAVMRVRDEMYAVTTNSIQNFQNVGGLNFPFQVNPPAMIPKGACATHAVCYFRDTLAFVGSGRNEGLSVYLAGFGQAIPISIPEVDRLLATLSAAQVAAIEAEQLVTESEQRLLIHLPTVTLVYHYQASQAAQKPIWSELAAGANFGAPLPAKHFACVDGTFYGGSGAGLIGKLDESVQTQFGAATTAQWDTMFLYNEGDGAILKSAELIGNANPGTANLSWTRDGKTYSPQQALTIGTPPKRMQWRPKTRMWNFMGLRFQLTGTVAGFSRLEVEAEPLNA